MTGDDHLIKERLRKLNEIKQAGVNPYAHKFDQKHKAADLQSKFKKLKKEEKTKTNVSVAGRLMTIRRMGKATFADLQDGSGRIQLYFNQDELGKQKYKFLKKLDMGDIIGAKGIIFKTRMGEVTVQVKKYDFLTKSIKPLPEKFHGLKDMEARYRQRYVDLIVNPEVKEVFMKRSAMKQAIREFMIKEGFVEVETPILQPMYGGGNAEPFKSQLNALNIPVYMRISNEMYLKRLITGGYDKVFEFSPDFRNEGVDKTHNPEFTQVETMCGYADYKQNMDFAEKMFEFVAKKVNKTTKTEWLGNKIELKRPWKRINLFDAIKKETGIDVAKFKNIDEAKKAAKKIGLNVNALMTKGAVILEIFEEKVQSKLIQPTMVYDYPADVYGLAKVSDANPEITEAFEIIINGVEMGLSYSEQNNPEVLRKYWKETEKQLKAGDEEAQRTDKDFLRSLEYGMPPVSGLGVGIDRMAMLLTNSDSIRDVILFPFMRPEN